MDEKELQERARKAQKAIEQDMEKALQRINKGGKK